MYSSNRDLVLLRPRLQALGQHIDQGFQRRVLYQMYVHRQPRPPFPHRSWPFGQMSREYHALRRVGLDYRRALQG